MRGTSVNSPLLAVHAGGLNLESRSDICGDADRALLVAPGAGTLGKRDCRV